MKKRISNVLPDEAMSAIHSKDMDKIGQIIVSGNINDVFADGRTLLMYAVITNNEALAEWLLLNGANPNLQDKSGWTALHFAAQEYLPNLVDLLLRHKALPDIRDKYGNTPLWRAVYESKGRGNIIKLLISSGADPNLVNNFAKNPLDLANTIANYDVKQFFSDLGGHK